MDDKRKLLIILADNVKRKEPRWKSQYDLFDLYESSVQDYKHDLRTITDLYKRIRGKPARTMREDFCGTFGPSYEWVKADPKNVAYALDLDPAPLQYGMKHRFEKLNPQQQKRIHILKQNVLSITPPADFITALNFSYYIFKERALIKRYFENCFASLNKSGMLFMDMVGGLRMQEPSIDRRRMKSEKTGKSFTYIWDQKTFDPITNEALFSISFKMGPGKIFKDAFTYDWRMWSIPELKDILLEVGFKKFSVYWEGTSHNGEGSGAFYLKEHEENCDVWIAYLVAQKS